MTKVSVNAPKTPVTEGSSGIAAATLPNVCKMPGPPAPFVPTPLPNIGKSGTDPKGYSKSVTIEGKKVAIKGATFGSMGDVASKGTGGGLISSNVEGPTSFVGPGSMDVKIEGKNVQLLGDPMLNNCGPSGSPANAATMMGLIQQPSGLVTYVTGEEECPLCKKTHGSDAALEETQATKDSAKRLVDALSEKKYDNATMVGVVQCKCPERYYADHSGAYAGKTENRFHACVKDLGWHGPLSEDGRNAGSAPENENEPKDHPVKAFLKDRFKEHKNYEDYKVAVDEKWEDAAKLNRNYNANKSLPAAYVPGSCAAPRALVRIMQDNGYPASISEKWFHRRGKNNPTGGKGEDKADIGKIKYDEQIGAVRKKGETRKFDHGETVPPCEACNIILPMFLCPEGQVTKCQHGTKETK
ncbi:DUF4150 domain-containing protein [Archangium minus]|uniref:DUF4150 domain-containing protein n=1 Tax=Archangium minus TaxID=83450 RepID=A0ABY9WYA1_9BACT|nr:DUF4150 domain-containing protein [Archangium minus]